MHVFAHALAFALPLRIPLPWAVLGSAALLSVFACACSQSQQQTLYGNCSASGSVTWKGQNETPGLCQYFTDVDSTCTAIGFASGSSMFLCTPTNPGGTSLSITSVQESNLTTTKLSGTQAVLGITGDGATTGASGSVSFTNGSGGPVAMPASVGATANAIASAPSVALVAGGSMAFDLTLSYEQAELDAPYGGGGDGGGDSGGGGSCNQAVCTAFMNQCAAQPDSQLPCYCAAACDCWCSNDTTCEQQNLTSAMSLGGSCPGVGN